MIINLFGIFSYHVNFLSSFPSPSFPFIKWVQLKKKKKLFAHLLDLEGSHSNFTLKIIKLWTCIFKNLKLINSFSTRNRKNVEYFIFGLLLPIFMVLLFSI